MGTAGRSAPLRRTGSLLGLLGLELAAVAGLHWLGRLEGLRIGWDDPVHWLLSSPVQDVLGALLRTVGLVMAYWLLASTLLYLLASLTRLPAAVRAVGWATLPMVRRVADHAVAVTLATSMVGGGTLGVAGPALAADRGRAGPPARKPVAAAQAAAPAQDEASTTTSRPAYTPKVAGQPSTDADQGTAPGGGAPSSESTPSSESSTPTTPTTPPTTKPTTTPTAKPTTTPPTTTPPTTKAPTTTEPKTTTTRPPTTTSTTRPPTTSTTRPTTQPPYVPKPAGPPSRGAATTAPTTQTTAPPSSTTSTTGLRPPAYRFPAAGTSPAPKEPPSPTTTGGGGGSGGGGSTGSQKEPSEKTRASKPKPHKVKRGESLWTIARDRLASAQGGSGEPTNREVARYWLRVVAANKHHLWSGDPYVIFPKEPIILPRPPDD